jgi:hypothetical protein
MSEDQSYEFERNESAPIRIFRLTKTGAYREGRKGPQLRIGERDKYHDFSF